MMTVITKLFPKTFPFNHLTLKEVREWETLRDKAVLFSVEVARFGHLQSRKYHVPEWDEKVG